MRRALVLGVLLVTGCPDDDGPRNPPKLWLSLIGMDERRVQLVPAEPDPF
jgi:hypothetical protein